MNDNKLHSCTVFKLNIYFNKHSEFSLRNLNCDLRLIKVFSMDNNYNASTGSTNCNYSAGTLLIYNMIIYL